MLWKDFELLVEQRVSMSRERTNYATFSLMLLLAVSNATLFSRQVVRSGSMGNGYVRSGTLSWNVERGCLEARCQWTRHVWSRGLLGKTVSSRYSQLAIEALLFYFIMVSCSKHKQ
jgi:hypothetical protein